MEKNELLKMPLFSAALGNQTMTGTNTLTSPVINLRFLDNLGVQLHFTGTPNGTFQVQVSGDHEQDPQGVVTVQGTFVPVTLSPVPVAAGAPDDIYIDLNQLSAPWVRVQYVNSSSVGVLSGFATAKSVGA